VAVRFQARIERAGAAACRQKAAEHDTRRGMDKKPRTSWAKFAMKP
jgi:hypothetical protein